MYSVEGHDNDLYFFYDREDVRRCATCGLLSDKWSEDLRAVAVPKLKLDVSYSYDGVMVVSERFRAAYEQAGMTGLTFGPLSRPGCFAPTASRVLEYDAVRRRTRFLDKCAACGRFEQVIGADPVLLKAGAELGELEFARTDLEFGHRDEMSPLILCGDAAASELKRAKLRGLELSAVAAIG